MTAYVTEEEYTTAAHVTKAPEGFAGLAERASEYLDDVTRDYYQLHSIDDDPFAMRVTRFKRAVIRQIEYMATSGITTTEQAKRQPVSGSKTIGKTTVTKSWGSSNSATDTASVISDDAIAALRGTGLLYRGVDHV